MQNTANPSENAKFIASEFALRGCMSVIQFITKTILSEK
jgi:hypothetical protein